MIMKIFLFLMTSQITNLKKTKIKKSHFIIGIKKSSIAYQVLAEPIISHFC